MSYIVKKIGDGSLFRISYIVCRISAKKIEVRNQNSEVRMKKQKCHCEERSNEAISISYCVSSIALGNKKEKEK